MKTDICNLRANEFWHTVEQLKTQDFCVFSVYHTV